MLAPPKNTIGLLVSQAIACIQAPRTRLRLEGISHTKGPMRNRCTRSHKTMPKVTANRDTTPRNFK